MRAVLCRTKENHLSRGSPILHLDICAMFGNRLVENGRPNERRRGLGRASARSTSPLALQRTGELGVVRAVAELVVDAAEPVAIFFFTQPVAVSNANHDSAHFAFPSLSVGAVWREGLPVDIGDTGD